MTPNRPPYHVIPVNAGGAAGPTGPFTLRLDPGENGSFVVSFFHDPRRSAHHQDDVGALYYVIAVILIYGCSIIMMIASYIRKNKVDRRLNRYLKEMANVRKRERRMALMTSSTSGSAAAKVKGKVSGSGSGLRLPGVWRGKTGSRGGTRSPSPSLHLASSGRESPAVVRSASNSPMIELNALPASGFPFLGVDPLHWPGLLQPNHQLPPPRPNSPVLIVSDYDSDSDRSERYCHQPHPAMYPPATSSTKGGGGDGGLKSVKLCVPVSPTLGEPDKRRRRCSDQGGRAAKEFGSRQQQDSLNSSDCRSDEEVDTQRFSWTKNVLAVSNV